MLTNLILGGLSGVSILVALWFWAEKKHSEENERQAQADLDILWEALHEADSRSEAQQKRQIETTKAIIAVTKEKLEQGDKDAAKDFLANVLARFR